MWWPHQYHHNHRNWVRKSHWRVHSCGLELHKEALGPWQSTEELCFQFKYGREVPLEPGSVRHCQQPWERSHFRLLRYLYRGQIKQGTLQRWVSNQLQQRQARAISRLMLRLHWPSQGQILGQGVGSLPDNLRVISSLYPTISVIYQIYLFQLPNISNIIHQRSLIFFVEHPISILNILSMLVLVNGHLVLDCGPSDIKVIFSR